MKDFAIEVTGKGFALHPAQFAEAWVLRHIAGLKALRIYVELRVRGHGTVDSFYTAFGSSFTGHPDAISRAAEAFESSDFCKRLQALVMAEVSRADLLSEWKRRAEEFTVLARQHAMSINLALSDASENAFGGESGAAGFVPQFEYAEHMKLRDAEEMAAAEHEASDEISRARGAALQEMSDARGFNPADSRNYRNTFNNDPTSATH